MQENLGKACNISIFNIISKSLSFFMNNFVYFLRFLAYPILGQLAGLLIIFIPLMILKQTESVSMIPVVIICFLAGMFLFINAFWKYIIASAALNLTARDLITGRQPQAPKAYMANISKRSGKYIMFLFILAVISCLPLLLYIPFVPAVTGGIAAAAGVLPFLLAITLFVVLFYTPFFAFSMQSFAFEESLTPFENIKSSAILVSRYFFKTLLFLIAYTIVGLILSVFISAISNIIFINFDNTVKQLLSTTLSYVLTPLYCLMLTYWFLKLLYKNQEC